MLEEDFIRLRTPGETLQVRARRLPLSAAPADVVSGHRAAQVFRFGLENGDAQLVGAAQVLLRLLDGHAPSAQRALAFSKQSATFVAELVRRVESEFARGRLVAEFVTEAAIRTRDEVPESAGVRARPCARCRTPHAVETRAPGKSRRTLATSSGSFASG